jgi:hypothetical protein
MIKFILVQVSSSAPTIVSIAEGQGRYSVIRVYAEDELSSRIDKARLAYQNGTHPTTTTKRSDYEARFTG